MLTNIRGKIANIKYNDRGSIPIALFVTIMFLALSISIVGTLTWQIGQNRAEDNGRNAKLGLDSAIGVAAEVIGPSTRALSGVPIIEPTTWTAFPIGNNNIFYHWWVSSSSNAAVNPSILPAGNWSTAAFGNNLWVAINSTGMAYTSPDGTVWTQHNALPNTPDFTYTHLTYGLGKYIATSSTAATTIATSADGITWTSVTIGTSDVYLPTCSTTTCVFISNSSAAGYYSTNLSTFSAIPIFPFTANAVAFAVTTFVAVGNGSVATSTDGAAWTTRTVSAHPWSSVGAVNGKWVAAYSAGAGSTTITTSPDAKIWTDQTLTQSGNWIGLVPAGPQMILVSGPINGTAQSTYFATSDGINWVSNSLTTASPWIGVAGSFKAFLIYPNSTTGYIVPITIGAKASQTLTVSARVQAGKVTNLNNGQYLATMSFNWNAATKHWSSVRYTGSSASSLSVTPDPPTGVTAVRTVPGSITISWIPPVNNGSSAVSSYTATASGGGYICPDGGQLAGTTCTILTSSAATYSAQYYTCPAGDSLSGSTCIATSTYTATNNPAYYTCNAGDSLNGSTCTNTTTYVASGRSPHYTCNAGDSLNGSTCTHITTYAATYNASYYSCTAGDSLSGSTCTHTTAYAATDHPAFYYCPSGGTVAGSRCLTSTVTAAVYNSGAYQCVSATETTCTISGMADGTYTFSVTATNGEGTSAPSVASALVQPQLMVISYVATTFATTSTQSLTPTVTGSSGATLTYAETGALPPGTTFNTSTGVLTREASGVTTGYPLSISVSVTDSLTSFTAIGTLVFSVMVP